MTTTRVSLEEEGKNSSKIWSKKKYDGTESKTST